MRMGGRRVLIALVPVVLLVVVLDDERSAIPAVLAPVNPAGAASGGLEDLCRVAYGAMQPVHNKYMGDIGDNSRVG